MKANEHLYFFATNSSVENKLWEILAEKNWGPVYVGPRFLLVKVSSVEHDEVLHNISSQNLGKMAIGYRRLGIMVRNDIGSTTYYLSLYKVAIQGRCPCGGTTGICVRCNPEANAAPTRSFRGYR